MTADRRYDALSRTEFLDTTTEIRNDIKEILQYQREQNSKVSTAFERLGVLEERTQSLRDNPARLISLGSFAVTVILFLLTLLHNK